MNESGQPLDRLAEIDALCDRFEQALKQDESPDIESYVAQADEEIRESLREELVKLQQAYTDTATVETRIAPLIVSECQGELNTTHIELPDRYRFEKVLGEGTFGRVIAAYDNQLQRRVAIKMRRASQASIHADVNEFLEEARRIAMLDHPHIVPIFDAGSLGDGSVFIVSKLIEGGSLKDFCAGNEIPFSLAAQLTMKIANALQYAHRQGIIHRDVKPHNILISKTGEPYLTDFGLALVRRERSARHGQRALLGN